MFKKKDKTNTRKYKVIQNNSEKIKIKKIFFVLKKKLNDMKNNKKIKKLISFNVNCIKTQTN